MARLTNGMRDNLVRRVLKFKFEVEEKKLAVEMHKVFDAVVDAVQGKHKAQIEALPKEWFDLTQSFEVRPTLPQPGGGRRPSITVSGSHPRPAAGKLSQWRVLDEKVVGKKAYGVAVDYANKYAAMLDSRSELAAKLRALVNSVTTTNKLYEVWPELAEIVPMPDEPIKGAAGTALTVSVAELNKTIPLPSKAPKKKATKK